MVNRGAIELIFLNDIPNRTIIAVMNMELTGSPRFEILAMS